MKTVVALWRLVAGWVIKLLWPARRRLGWAALLPLVAVLYLTIWGVHAWTIVVIVIALAGPGRDGHPVAVAVAGDHGPAAPDGRRARQVDNRPPTPTTC
jgi:hypothetical protein